MIGTIGVVGAGQMGGGIAQVCAQAGYEVVLFDVVEAQLAKARSGMEKSLRKLAEKGGIDPAAVEPALARVKTVTELEAMAAADLVVEAVNENEALKLEIFRKLDGILRPEAILASNTSSISITKLASATKRPSKVIGMHFFNPVPLMKLVEITRGHETGDETYAAVAELAAKVGKESAVVQDYPGFIVNRILVPMLNEAAYAVYENLATPEDIDKAMKLGTNQPMGPLTLADFIGLDTCLAILRVLYEGLGNPKYAPCPLLVQMVAAGTLGAKSGEGFY
ncbi:MAG TPA: 3-hydroxyacyl-CoA dehydrogenase NAD-binding domain-containing protein, partial [Spirochaetia bacterium]|nr:3-hydroxyacyl-CoA dehydrogenase NAD-binding domain-containing protein [Spirochaetia bacterium]